MYLQITKWHFNHCQHNYLLVFVTDQIRGRVAYSDCLRVGRSGDRIPVGARFSAPVQTGPEAHPSLLYNGYRLFPGGKVRPGRDADPSPPYSAEVKNRVELYLYSPQWHSWPVKE